LFQMWTLHFYMIHMLYILHFTWINIRPKHLDSKIFRFEKYCSANSQAKILHLLNFYCSKCLHVHCSLPSNYTLMIICFICGVLVSWFVLVSCLIVISNFWIVMLLFVVPFVLMQGSLHASLVEVVRAHKMLRTSPYCKRIFSKTQFKKWCSNKTTTTTTTICCCVRVFRIWASTTKQRGNGGVQPENIVVKRRLLISHNFLQCCWKPVCNLPLIFLLETESESLEDYV
jgi:hypothetical protein